MQRNSRLSVFDTTVDVCVGCMLLTRLYDGLCAVLELAKLTKQQKAYQRQRNLLKRKVFSSSRRELFDKEERYRYRYISRLTLIEIHE